MWTFKSVTETGNGDDRRRRRRRRNLTDVEARWQFHLENKRTSAIGIHDDNIKDSTRKRTIVAAISGGGFAFDEEINNIKEMVATSIPLVPPPPTRPPLTVLSRGSNTKREIFGRRVHTDVRRSVFTLRPRSGQTADGNNVVRVANEKRTY